ncbi:MAG: hypothetical protein P8X48_10465 [Acidiferrobacteraceae bacterium]|jgi:hypothetical protein
MYKKTAGLILILALGTAAGTANAASLSEGRWVADGVYRGLNFRGLTGLFITDSAYTIGKNNFAISGGYASESVAGNTINAVPVSITYGYGAAAEISISGSAINSTAASGIGDSSLSWKWRFRRQSEYLPAMAMGAAVIAPGTNAAISTVSTYGVRLNGMASSEAALTETGYIGLYVDVQLDAIDPGSSSSDYYYSANAGGELPLSDDKRLQLIGEVNYTTSHAASVDNYTGYTGGLRYTSRIFQYSLAGSLRSRGDGSNTSQAMFNLTIPFF